MQKENKLIISISKLFIEVNQLLLMNILNELNEMSIHYKLKDFTSIIQEYNKIDILNSLTIEQLKDIRQEITNIILNKENNINILFENINTDWAIVG